MHYHQCHEFVDASAGPSSRRLLGVTALNVVNDSYAVSQHYRSCFAKIGRTCDQLLANTHLDDTVLRYRAQLIDNVRRTLAGGL